MRLLQAIEGYQLSGGANHLSKSSLDTNIWAITCLSQFIGDIELSKIKEDDLDQFFVWLATEYKSRYKEHLSTGSLVNAWKGIRSYFGWLQKRNIIKVDISRNIKMPENPEIEIWPYTENEIKLMFDGCNRKKTVVMPGGKTYSMVRSTATRNTALLSVLLDTGIRSMECCRLKVKDIDMKSGSIWIEPFGSRRKSKGRHVYISDVAKHNLWLHLTKNESEFVFNTINKIPFNRSSLLQAIGYICQDSGIQKPTVHRFRHTFAVQYILNGGDPFTLMRLLGHTTMWMVNRYLQFTRSDLATSHRKASPMDNWFGKK